MSGHQLADTKSASAKMEGNCLSTDGVDANQGLECVVEVPFAHSCEDCILAAALASSRRLSLHLRLPLALRSP